MQFKKGIMTEIYSSHSVLINGVACHIRDLCPQQRSALSEDNGNDQSFERDSNMPLFFSARPTESSAESEETDSNTSI